MKLDPPCSFVPGVILRIVILFPVVVSGIPHLAEAEEHAVPVTTVQAETVEGFVREISLTGSVTSPRRARLSSRTEGLVQEMKVDAGSLVNEGDVLMTLDTRLAEITLERIEAEIERAEVEVADAKRRVEEVRELAETGGFAKSEAESLKSALKVSEANLKQLQVSRAEQAETIDRHRLVAPFAGVISEKLSEAGEWVTTGTPVAELVEIKGLRFDLQVPQEFLPQVEAAESVVVRLDAYPDQAFRAHIAVIVPVKDAVSRTFLTRLAIDDPENLAAPGMSGKATIQSRPREKKAVRIPRDAVVRYPDGTARVWVVSGEGDDARVSSRLVTTAGALGDMAEVIEGLSGGERVVLKGNEGLREDQIVVAKPVE